MVEIKSKVIKRFSACVTFSYKNHVDCKYTFDAGSPDIRDLVP